jgi:hypothetical protein
MKRFTAFVAVTLLLSTVACNGFVGEARITTAGASDAKPTTTQAAAEQKKSTDQPKGTSSGDAGRSQRR